MRVSNKRGSIVVAMMILTFLFYLVWAGADLALAKMRNAARSYDDANALYVAEAGLADAVFQENLASGVDGNGQPTTNTGGLSTWYGIAIVDGTGEVKTTPNWKTAGVGECKVTRTRVSPGVGLLSSEGRYPPGSAAGSP